MIFDKILGCCGIFVAASLMYSVTVHFYAPLCQMPASEMVSVLSVAERVVAVMISRSAVLFRLPDAVLLEVERQLTVLERGAARPSRRLERRCAMKRARAKVPCELITLLRRFRLIV